MDAFDPGVVAALLGDAAASEFARTCAIFALASWIHSRKVATEIRTQSAALIEVVRADLIEQQKISTALAVRVGKIEEHLQLGGNSNGG